MYITAFFTNNGDPALGLTPTLDVYKVSDATHEVNAQNMTEVAGGWYRYDFSGYVEGTDYVIVADGGLSLGVFERYIGGGNETFCDFIDAIKTKTDALPSGITKNVALPNFSVFMVLSSDHVTPAVGKAITGTVGNDGVAEVALTNVVVEMGLGKYKVDLTQAERNADVSTLTFSGLDCDQRVITIYSS